MRDFHDTLYQEKSAKSEEVDLLSILNILWKRRLLISLVIIAHILLSTILVFFVLKPVYKHSIVVAFGNYKSNLHGNINSVREIASSTFFMKRLGYVNDEVIGELKEKIAVEQINNTNLFKVTVLYSNYSQSKELAEKVVSLLIEIGETEYQNHRQIIERQLYYTRERLKEIEDEVQIVRKNMINANNQKLGSNLELDLARFWMVQYYNDVENRRIALFDREVKLQDELQSLKNMEVIRDDDNQKRPVKPNKKVIITLFGSLGLFVGILSAYIVEYFLTRARRHKSREGVINVE